MENIEEVEELIKPDREKTEAEKKLEFIQKHNALVKEYGYDFLVRISLPEVFKLGEVKVNIKQKEE